jgi:hypothetical protein
VRAGNDGPCAGEGGRYLVDPRRRRQSLTLAALVASEPLREPRDLGVLSPDDLLEHRDPLPRVLSRDASTVAVVATPAGGGKVRWLPEQLRRLRGRDDVMDACRVIAAARPSDPADVAVALEHGPAKPLPGRRVVARISRSAAYPWPAIPQSACLIAIAR